MSVEAMAWAFQVPLKPCPKSVLVALANRADSGGYCWPGIDDLQVRTGWSVRAIQMGIKELVGAGLLVVSPRFLPCGTQSSNLYQLIMPATCYVWDGIEGAGRAGGGGSARGGRAHGVQGGGAPPAPKSSSEQSVEQSSEQDPPTPQAGGAVCVVDTSVSEFHQFWEAYPVKEAKKEAFKAWQKARDRPALSVIVSAIELAKAGRKWREGYIPRPATWINRGSWDDEVVSVLPRQARTFSELIG